MYKIAKWNDLVRTQTIAIINTGKNANLIRIEVIKKRIRRRTQISKRAAKQTRDVLLY